MPRILPVFERIHGFLATQTLEKPKRLGGQGLPFKIHQLLTTMVRILTSKNTFHKGPRGS
jgi:hypothetical protein